TGSTVSFAAPVTLGGAASVTGTTVTFRGPVDDAAAGADRLAVQGNAVFGKAIGANKPLASVTVSGTTSLGGGVATLGDQSYQGALRLAAAAVLSSSAAGDVTFGATVDGPFGLTVNTAGVTTFGGAVGGTAPLGAVTTDAAGSTQLAAGVTTTGAQSFGDAVQLAGAATLTSTTVANISLTGGGDGAFDL